MFNKLNTKILLIISVVLIGLIALSKYQSKKSENTFREEFIKIDTSLVQQLLIYPKSEKGKEIKITRTKAGWELQNDKVKTFADSNTVREFLKNFVDMKSVSLAAQNKEGWEDLQLYDTSGTIIKIICKDQSYNIVVGKFAYSNETRSGLTYVRYLNEEAAYTVSGFLALNVNQGFNSWRKKTFISGNKNNWTSLTFTYPGDSSFVLNKNNNLWTVNGQPADSLLTEQYLNRISNMPCSGFMDAYTLGATPIFTLSIQGNNQHSPITVNAYPDISQKYILHSSLNADAYFSEAQSRIAESLFVGRNKFLKPVESKKKK